MLLMTNALRTRIFSCLLALALVLGISPVARADKLQEYSAEQVLIKDGKEQPIGNLYFSKEKIRIDHTMPGAREKALIIFRQDRKLSYTVFPDKKKYLENALSEKDMKKQFGLPMGGAKDFSMKEESLGTETINGYKCEKKRIETTMEIMGRKMTGQSTVWISDKFDFPIRTEDQHGNITELRNIKTGGQDQSLFEIPADFTKADNIMEAIGGMGAGHPAGGDVRRRGPSGMPAPGQTPPEMPEEMRKMLEKQMQQQPPQQPEQQQ